MTKKNKLLLAAAGAAVLILLICVLSLGGGKTAGQSPASTTATAGTAGVYTVELCNDSGMPLEGVGIYVYTDDTQAELVWFARTDAEGRITFRDVTCEGYIAVLDGVSTDYIVEESYPLLGEVTTIVVQAQMQSGVDLSEVTRTLGDVMFDFTLTDTEGVEYTLSELLKEKDAVVLNFWYLNCGPCKQEFPFLQEAYEEYSDRIEVLAMNPVDGTEEEIAVFKKELELTFPMFKCDPEWANAMELTAYPTTVIIDRFGMISLIHKGSVTSTKVFTDAFAYFTAEEFTQGVVEDIGDLETEAPGSNPAEPIELGGKLNFTVTIPAGGEVYYHLYRVNGYLTVSNKEVYAVYDGYTYKAGSVRFTIKSPDTYSPAKLTLGNSTKEAQTVTVNIAKPGGTVDNPYSVTLGKEFTTSVPAGNEQGVYYQVTANKAGYLVFECLDVSDNLEKYDYIMQKVNPTVQRSLQSEGNEDKTKFSMSVKAGDVVKCWIVADKDKSGNTYPGGTFKSKLYISDTPVTEETAQTASIDYAVTVTDEKGNPVKGVSLNMDKGDGKINAVVTDEKGVAHEKMKAGTYPVTVLLLPDGYSAATTAFTLTEDRPVVSLKLKRDVVVMETYTFTVVDAQGRPVAGARVTAGEEMAVTDENGKVTLELEKGSQVIYVEIEGSAPMTYITGADETDVNITFQEEAEDDTVKTMDYTVKVMTYSGEIKAGVTVQIKQGSTLKTTVTTDSTGVAVAQLPAGDYTVTLKSSGMYYETSTAVLSAARPYLVIQGTTNKLEENSNYYFASYGKAFDIPATGAYYTGNYRNKPTMYFVFGPTQQGVYRFTLLNPSAAIAYWAGSTQNIFAADPPMGYLTERSFEVNVKETNLGADYIFSMSGVASSIVVVERVGDAILDETDMEKTVYKGSSTPTAAYKLTGSAPTRTVDMTAATGSYTPVLGSDGYYHLNSKTGPLLYVNLGPNAPYVSMYQMLGLASYGGTSLIKYFYDTDGTLLKKEDYTECMIQYVNCRDTGTDLYPLTEDLIYMLKNGGEHAGWWDKTSSNFLFASLGNSFNPELGWMFAVYY